MLNLIAREIILDEAIGEQRRLAKTEAQAFAGDGIDSAGGVSDERDVVAIDVMQSPADGDRSALAGSGFCVLKASGKLGKVYERGIEPQVLVRADEREADFITAYGRDIDLRISELSITCAPLTVIRPVQLHEIAPGSDAVMASESKASFFFLVMIEAGPSAGAGIGAVRADDPARRHKTICEQNAFAINADDRRLPKHRDACIGSMVDKNAMQNGAADSAGVVAAGKDCFGLLTAAHKANAAERLA